MKTVSEELCVCRKELDTQTTALKRAAHDREELAKDKAVLAVKLNSTERKACGLAQELATLRSECACVCLCGLTYIMFGTSFRPKSHSLTFFTYVMKECFNHEK